MAKATVVLGVIGSDCHAVGNKILDYSISRAGYNVINIGVLSPQEDFINAAVETNADAILVSSLYGQGELDCQGLREKCDEAGLKGIKLYVGGNIVVGKQDFNEVKKRFQKMGFDRIYPPGTSIETTLRDLAEDFPDNEE
ncbi:methylaspartate mutase subunit S [Citroniella saccharovorans]|uniref:Glutamate mutase sigma subunit n=1 Tax=Citroniella saccharovorans TaxID=2053367 RepID=A0AAW9MQV4_9FIRM|nr:methylaspartate mutase subunit S [Citroniella saccharovorans]MEB3428501.1 methylaspartate mutase subunit S [Citroniella saccharovorans]